MSVQTSSGRCRSGPPGARSDERPSPRKLVSRPARPGPRERRCLAESLVVESFPARSGESGLLDVPDAETLGLGGGRIGAELRWDRDADGRQRVGISPVAIVVGLGRVEAGLAMREGGLPGDPRPSPYLFGGALKVHLLDGRGLRPALAVDAVADRVNFGPRAAVRLIASAERDRRYRVAAFLGGELYDFGPVRGGPVGASRCPRWGRSGWRVIQGSGDAGLSRRGGAAAGARGVALALGLDWQPSDNAFRATAAGFHQPAPKRRPAPPCRRRRPGGREGAGARRGGEAANARASAALPVADSAGGPAPAAGGGAARGVDRTEAEGGGAMRPTFALALLPRRPSGAGVQAHPRRGPRVQLLAGRLLVRGRSPGSDQIDGEASFRWGLAAAAAGDPRLVCDRLLPRAPDLLPVGNDGPTTTASGQHALLRAAPSP